MSSYHHPSAIHLLPDESSTDLKLTSLKTASHTRLRNVHDCHLPKYPRPHHPALIPTSQFPRLMLNSQPLVHSPQLPNLNLQFSNLKTLSRSPASHPQPLYLIPTLRARAHHIAVCQKLPQCLGIKLLLLLFHQVSVAIQLVEDVLCNLGLLPRGGAPKVVELDVKPFVHVPVDGVVFVADSLLRDPFFKRLGHCGGGAQLSCAKSSCVKLSCAKSSCTQSSCSTCLTPLIAMRMLCKLPKS